MAGYVFTFSSKEDALECIKSGIYSTLMKPKWSTAAEATLGDYVTMKPGDDVYFFSNRMIYGVGKILDLGGGRCVVENFLGATTREAVVKQKIRNPILQDNPSIEKIMRWVVAFEPAPMFFDYGIDMDDLLSSNPSAFKSLRVFWKRSFIKLDDEENLAFRSALMRLNLSQFYGERGMPGAAVPLHEKLSKEGREPDVPQLLAASGKADGSLSSEMLLEVGLLYQLSRFDPKTVRAFGHWDYLSHQVVASPSKPIDYMDRMDVFGYRHIEGYEPIIERYLMAELKKGEAQGSDVPQVMKYVDWVRSEYAHGDYSMVSAFLVAHKFKLASIAEAEKTRDYVVGCKPAISRKWDELAFVAYSVRETGYIDFERVDIG